jgi:hypothetical protein
MQGLRILKGAVLGWACLGIVAPQADLWAAGPKRDVKSSRVPKAPQVFDVALTPGGTFTGHVVDSQGIGVEGAVVSIRQGNREVARTVTDRNGTFVARNLRGGMYQVVGGRGEGLYRLWAANTAPPSAQSQALIVSSSQVVRGQFGGISPGVMNGAALGLGIGGLVTGIVGITKAQDAQDDADKALKLLNQHLNTPASGP